MLLPNTKLFLLLFSYNIFYQIDAYHLMNKNGTEFRTLIWLFNDEKLVDINREKVNTFLKSINFQRYDDDAYECKGTECKGENQKCVPKGNDYYCDCNEHFKLVDEYKKRTKDIQCRYMYMYECKGTECEGENQKCVPKGEDYYCECYADFELVDEGKKGTKDIQCKAITHNCGYGDCLGANTQCVPIGKTFKCECLRDFEPEDVNKKDTRELACKAITYTCKSGDCPGVNTQCVPIGKTFKCECLKDFEPEDLSKKDTRELACKAITYTCKSGDCPGVNTQCVSIGKKFKCECLKDFEPEDVGKIGTKDLICKGKDKCDCGVRSTACKRDEEGKPICDCFEGYAQYRDICLDCYCGQHSLSCSFDDVGNKKCLCIAGYAQRNITCAEMCRSNSDCLNGGICKYDRNGYFCSCKEHYKGDRCETNDVCDSMIEKCEAIGAVCTYNELLRKGFCECPPSRTFNRKQGICEDICKPGICVHGKCEVVDYHKKCRCYEGYEGDDCDKKISKITDKLEWSIVLALLIASLTCFITIILCFLKSRK